MNLAAGARLVVWCSGKDRKSNPDKLHTNFKLNGSGEYLGLLRADGFTVEDEYAPAYPPQATDKTYGVSGGTTWQAVVGPAHDATSYSLAMKARVPASAADQGDAWRTVGYSDAAWTTRTVGVEGGTYRGVGFDTTGNRSFLIHSAGSVQTTPAMSAVRASIHLRFPFTVANAAAVQALQFKIKNDDGFIIYINGTKVLEANAPVTRAYNSAATADREDDQSEDFDVYSLPGAQTYLVNGSNVLAIQGLSDAASNALFILAPILEARVLAGGAPGTVGYLQQLTPGTENTVSTTIIGPDISQTTKNPARPAPGTNVPFTISARVRQTLQPIQRATCACGIKRMARRIRSRWPTTG